jgi:hypothetical protein
VRERCDLIDDVDAVFGEQASNALPDQRCVVGDYDAHGKRVPDHSAALRAVGLFRVITLDGIVAGRT